MKGQPYLSQNTLAVKEYKYNTIIELRNSQNTEKFFINYAQLSLFILQ